MSSVPPQYLYKYFSLSSAHTEEVLSAPFLHFSRPADFNDPFDCTVRYTFDSGNADDLGSWYKTAIAALVAHDPRSASKVDRTLVEEYRRRYPRPDAALKTAIVPVLQADLKSKLIGVLCLSETGTDPVMFYHYCNNHAGICVRFTTRDDSLFWHAEPVSYGDTYPVVEFFDSSDNVRQFETIFLTKYSGWKYEKEWRVIDFMNGPGPRQYPKELLSGVIFGMRTTNADKARVAGWLKKRDHAVELLQAEQQDDSYQMKLVTIAI